MFTLIAYSNAKDCLGVFTSIPAVQDQHVKTAGDFITVPTLNNIVGSYCLGGATIAEARLVSPSLRRVNPLYIAPVELVSVPSLDPLMMYHPENPIALDVNESLEAQIDATNADVAQKMVLVWLADGALTPVTGEIFTVNAHLNVELIVDTWQFSEIEFPDSLPVADYDVVGARLVGVDLAAFRFVPVGQAHRPGGVGSVINNQADPWCQRFGRMGVWFDFNTVQPPGIECLGGAAEAAADIELYIDLIKK